MKNKTIIYLFVLLLFASCGKNRKRQHDLDEISNMKKEFEQSIVAANYDVNKANKLVVLYDQFIEEYPKDSLIPEMMIAKAIIQASYLGETKNAVSDLVQISEKFPKSPQAPQGLFLAADFYQSKLKDFDNARKCYQKMIEDYPKDPLTPQAKILLQNLGKTPEELLEIILQKKGLEDISHESVTPEKK
ncbi:MAG: tetratricopeptide repeat protein [Sphingobacteriales bacterium]|nr:tetratricopeptide repeat protein [Sphingobacteriales bacterium]